MERRSVYVSQPGTRNILQYGDPGFRHELGRLYATPENDALEALVALKAHLRTLSTRDFGTALTEGMSTILGADMTFVMKRVRAGEHDAAVDVPSHGALDSGMMAAALHYCADDGARNALKGTPFHAYGCPCGYMSYDKVVLIPENLDDFITDHPNKLPMAGEAYLAVPLFADGACFAHFGAIWSKDAAARRRLSWAFIEMLLHSLEDMVAQRLLDGVDVARPAPVSRDGRHVIPRDTMTTLAQSLRPYAGSLSHELRTPMQGVVGMLDVMYATVQDTVDTQTDPTLCKIFEDLKQNIEVVQDSSRRAVEAADNVVHAYDMDMSVPDGPVEVALEEESTTLELPLPAFDADRCPDILIGGSNLPISRPRKRRRDEAFPRQSFSSGASSPKIRNLETAPTSAWSRAFEPSQEIMDGLQEAEDDIEAHAFWGATPADAPTLEDARLSESATDSSTRTIAPGLRHADIREVFQYVIDEGLKVGGRPDSAMAQETEYGEYIEVRSRGSDGTIHTKVIEWSVDPSVPSTMFVDEKDLTKLISCVFLNAIKFSDHGQGHVCIHARMSRGKYVSIGVSDNGPGIPAAFLPKLFKPFSQENSSMTRQSDGLGLGLMVAKGIARKLSGNLTCTRAETEGPNHGSEFEIRVPVVAGETISRPVSPFASPVPRRMHSSSQPETPHIPPLADGAAAPPPPPPPPPSPPRPAKALDDAAHDEPASCNGHPQHPVTPLSPATHLAQSPRKNDTSPSTSPIDNASARPRIPKSVANPEIDSELANKYPLTFLVAEDNKINRKLLVSMLSKFGYKTIYEAHDGAEAVRQMSLLRASHDHIDVVLMDLWMPLMDGYEATQRILSMGTGSGTLAESAAAFKRPTVLAVTADVTDGALERAAQVGMSGFMSKPYKMMDLQRLIAEHCVRSGAGTTRERPAAIPLAAA